MVRSRFEIFPFGLNFKVNKLFIIFALFLQAWALWENNAHN